jgi:beta-lactamase regulating signal transducer with metallopeptidase domain
MWWWLVQNALLAGLLAAVVALVCRVGRFRPAVQHALWLLVLLKLLTPPQLVWPGAMLPLGPQTAVWQDARQAEPERAIAEPVRSETVPVLSEPEIAESMVIVLAPIEPAEPVEFVVSSAPAPAPAAQSDEQLTLPSWVTPACVWFFLMGTSLMALIQGVRLLRFGRLVSTAVTPPKALIAQAAELAARLGVRVPDVRVAPHVGTPLVCGFWRPVLLWPAALADRMTPECQRAVLVHELAHLRRRDHWVAWLKLAAGCLWWWNPLYWYVCRRLGEAAELACDAWVVATLPDARRSYAEALVTVAQLVSERVTPAPAVGMSVGRRREFERRLTMILCERTPYRAPALALVVIGLLALAVLPGWSVGQVPVEPAKAPPVVRSVPLTVAPPQDVIIQAEPLAFALQVPADDRDRKLQDLESKVEAILKELKSMRGGKAPAAKPNQPANVAPYKAEVLVQPRVGQLHLSTPVQAQVHQGYQVILADHANRTVTLHRVTYKLPKEKAEALASLLRDHAKDQVVETKVEGDGITVTTAPETQKAIGQFIGILTGKGGVALQFELTTPNSAPKPAPK